MAISMQDLIDIDLLAYFKSKLDLIFNTKVDKVAGKGLSTNDFTVGYKNKLDNIENNAQENDIETVKIDGSSLTIVNKAVNIPLVTNETPGLMSPSQKEQLDNASALPSGGTNGKTIVINNDEAVWDDPKNFEWYSINIDQNGNATMSAAIQLSAIENAIELKKLPIFRAYCDRNIIDEAANKYVYIPLTSRQYSSTTAYYIFSTIYNGYALKINLSYTNSGATFAFSFSREKLAKNSDLESKVIYYNVELQSTFMDDFYTLYGFNEELDDLYSAANDKKLQFLVIDDAIFLSLNSFDLREDYETLEMRPYNCHFYGNKGRMIYHAYYDDYNWVCEVVEYLTSDYGQTLSNAIAQKANSADVYTKTQIDQMLVGTFNYKGTKATIGDLPVSGNMTGDVWNVIADGSDWAWNGTAWEELGTTIDLSGYVQDTDIGLATNQDIDNMFTPYVSES